MLIRRRTHPSDEELLRTIDDAVAAAPSRRTRDHVSSCPYCQQRQNALRQTILDSITALRSDDPRRGSDSPAARVQFERRLAAEARRLDPAIARRARLTTATIARWSTAVVLLAAVLITARSLRSGSPRHAHLPPAPIERDALPIPSLTPGATADLTPGQLCRGEHPDVEPADPIVRQRILEDYGMADVPQHEYELDYLITPALGGANDQRNLWPERYTDRTWNAKVKDQLEDLLPTLVCEGTIDLRTAQQDIAVNWVEAYKKYFKTNVPLRSGT